MQEIEFNNPSIEVLFDLCLDDKGWTVDEDIQNNISRESLRDLLVEYKLQSYVDLLLDFQITWRDFQNSRDKRREEYDNKEKILIPYKLKISRILKMLLSSQSNDFKNLEFSVNDLYDRINISENYLFIPLIEVFQNEFIKLKLNYTELTEDEAIEAIKEFDSSDWFLDNGLDWQEVEEEPNLVTPWHIEKFRFDHRKPREISLNIVDEAIKKLENWQEEKKGRVGAKLKNIDKGELAKGLSILHRINTFLNQTKYSSIKDFPLNNKTCRFIYDYFELWGLLDSHIKEDRLDKENDKEKRTNYIKSIIRNHDKFLKNMNFDPERNLVMIDKNLELRIDSFKNVKDGLLTREEFRKSFTLFYIKHTGELP